MNSAMGVILLVAIISALIQSSHGECCAASKEFIPLLGFTKCGDDTPPTPCCGYGGCNMFCCNCDGGCRTGGRSDVEVTGPHGFQAIDKDGDGQVSLVEMRTNIAAGACGNPSQKLPLVAAEFARLDLDNDGFLSHVEINAP